MQTEHNMKALKQKLQSSTSDRKADFEFSYDHEHGHFAFTSNQSVSSLLKFSCKPTTRNSRTFCSNNNDLLNISNMGSKKYRPSG